MEWYYIIGIGLCSWLFGFATGIPTGMSSVMKTLIAKPPQPPQPTNPQDLAAMMQMMGLKPPGGPR